MDCGRLSMNNENSKPGVETPDTEQAGTNVPVSTAPTADPAAAPQGSTPAAAQSTGVAEQTGAPQSSAATGKPATTVTAGTLIMGTYEIEKLINSGGMGEVYRGRNIHNGEPVAIKIVLPSLAHDPKIVALFQKESTTLSRLSHEAIVRYHVFTVDPTIGRPCMVMEFVSGLPLSDRIEQGPMPLAEVKVMLRRVASGLDKAHRAGVVHRDLSPDNVILEEGSVEHAKLIDFGIAKSTAVGAGTLLQGQFAGKFNWVSPEQLGAFGGHVDGRSDIYSLALITAAASRGEVLPMGASIVDAVGKRAAVPDLAGVDPELVPLLCWMLQPDPEKRVDSMAKVMAAVAEPSLIPDLSPKPAAPDPNRTVIGGALPIIDTPLPGQRTGGDWPSAGQTGGTGVGFGGTGAVVQEAEDVSPFDTPIRTAPATASAQASVSATSSAPKKGKGGMIAALAVVVIGGGGAAAYFSGAFGPATQPAATETVSADATGQAPATDKAAEEKAAADKAAADKAAADKAAADQAASQTAEEKATADKAAADNVAEEKAASDKAAADKAAADKAAADKAAADKAAADKTAADKAAADKAAADQAANDPVAVQSKFLATYAMPKCAHVGIVDPKADGFVLNGYATAADPLEQFAKDWQKATKLMPDVAVHLINETQCPVLDFANLHPSGISGDSSGLKIGFPKLGEVVKSGSNVTGTVEGLNNRALSLFLVSESGGATNLKPWVSIASDGTATFTFTVSLAKGAPPAPQLLLAIATEKPLAKLDSVPNGVTARSLMPFIELQLADAPNNSAGSLGFFRLEN